MEFIFLLILVLIAVSFSLLLKLKIEKSIFLTVNMFFIMMLLSGLIAKLSYGFYIIVALSAVSLAYILYKSVKKEIPFLNIITPGFSIFVIGFTLYYLSTQGALVHMWDEATHWGISAKNMYYLDDLWTSGLQTIASPTYNQVMLKLTGYSESSLYLSQWTLYLACIALPLSNISWKKSYIAALFTMGSVFAVSSIFQDGNLTLYADGLLAFFFAALILGWYLEEDKGYKRYLWAGVGVFTLTQIKSGTGLSLAATFAVFAVFCDTFLNKTSSDRRKTYIHNIKTLVIFALIILLSRFSFSIFEEGISGAMAGGKSISSNLMTSTMFIIFSVTAAITFVLFALYTIGVFKSGLNKLSNKRLNTLLLVFSSLTFISILGVMFYSTILRPDFDVRTTVLNFIGAFSKTKILTLSVTYLIIAIILLYIVNILLAPKGSKKEFIIFYSAAVFLSGLYIIGVLYAYLSSFSLGEAVNTASFDRYVGTAIMFATMFAFMPFLKKINISFKKMLAPYIMLSACIAFLATNFIPSYTATQSTSEYAKDFRQTEIKARQNVEHIVSVDQKVFLIIQDDQGFVFNWMRYEFSPIKTNGGFWSFGDDGGWNFAWTANDLKEFLHKANYSYLYIQKTNEYFNNHFSSLFGDTVPADKTLYKFTYDDEVSLYPVE